MAPVAPLGRDRASWMPEQYYALGKPTGTVHLDAKTAAELATKLATFTLVVTETSG